MFDTRRFRDTVAYTLCAAIVGMACSLACAQGVSVKTVGLVGDGITNDTAALQAALDSGQTDLHFPQGIYLLSTVNVPANTNLSFSPKAQIIIDAPALKHQVEKEDDGKMRQTWVKSPLFDLKGNRIRISGLVFDFTSGGTDKDPTPLEVIVQATDIDDLIVSNMTITCSIERVRRDTRTLVDALNSSNLVLENSSASDINHMMNAYTCRNVTVRGNRMVRGVDMTTFSRGSESLNHHDNWSSKVGYQCVWRGGSPDPSRKAPSVPLGSANVAIRGLREGEPGHNQHTEGVFDVNIKNNYAEYGTVLCWGNKGRQVIIDGNIARYMWDYSFGCEGGENHIFSNNISINSSVAGIMSMYWGEKLLITGNMVIVRHEPFDAEKASNKKGKPLPESTYFGQFIRLHHGPSNEKDLYGAGSALISNNLFVNELANRPSGISIENGRDIMLSGNKIINGMLRKHDELSLIKTDAIDQDEFESSQTIVDDGKTYRLERRVTSNQATRLTVIGNEWISHQPGDKPIILINGTTASTIIKNNVIRKEPTYIQFTEAQKTMETGRPRFMLYSLDDFANRDLTNSRPDTAVMVQTDSPTQAFIQDNIIEGWEKAITTVNTIKEAHSRYLITGNTTDGRISCDGDDAQTIKVVRDNIPISKTR